MAACGACGTTIIFGGVKDAGLRFCNAKCRNDGALLSLARQLPPDVVKQQTMNIYHGACPKCQGPGPVDVHTAYFVWSAVFMTSWKNTPQVSCKACGVKSQLGNAAISLLVGWWGFPWGLIMTPVQIGRNIHGVLRRGSVDGPSSNLERVVSMTIAANYAVSARGTPAAAR
jgi:hypothetical protein